LKNNTLGGRCLVSRAIPGDETNSGRSDKKIQIYSPSMRHEPVGRRRCVSQRVFYKAPSG